VEARRTESARPRTTVTAHAAPPRAAAKPVRAAVKRAPARPELAASKQPVATPAAGDDGQWEAF
jgi:hypothetical protein